MNKQDSPEPPVYVGIDGKIVGVLEMQDEIRKDAAETIKRLHDKKIQTIMISGDRPGAAQSVGKLVGIDDKNVYGGVRPEGKAELVQDFQSKGKCVAMVGDGINDAAALAQADVGIAMADWSVPQAKVASITTLGDRLPQVGDAIDLSKATFNKIKQQNLGWAFGCNSSVYQSRRVRLLPAAYGLSLTPSVAGAIMGLSSLGVMGNSLLLKMKSRELSQWETMLRIKISVAAVWNVLKNILSALLCEELLSIFQFPFQVFRLHALRVRTVRGDSEILPCDVADPW